LRHAHRKDLPVARLGIFGGAFNPPHIGHLALAQEAHWQLGLDKVVLMPFGSQPSHRTLEADPGAEVRLSLCELAVGGDARFAVSRLEVDRAGPIYTVDTLRELSARSPGEELVLLVGGDQAAALRSWRSPEEILSLAVLGVAERDEWRREEIVDRLGGLCSDERVRFFDMPRMEVSSTLVRRRSARGEPIRYLVPDAVARFVEDRALYRASTAAVAS
jgi:nicotinate-nucleotide adenylyltransferase